MSAAGDLFRRAVRAALGLREPSGTRPGDPTELWRHGLYRARVDVCAADGSTVDVTPEDPRLSPMQAVPVRVSPPGATWQVAAGAVVLIGWERGDPTKVYACPSYESTTPITLTLTASTSITIDGGPLVDINGTSITCGPVGSIPVLVQGTMDSMGVPVTQLPACTNALKAG